MIVLDSTKPENAEYNPRYTMMGTIISHEAERRRGGKRWVRILSPYMLMVEADPSVIKNPNELERMLRESVNKEMSEFRTRLGQGMKDVTLDLMNQWDAEWISENLMTVLTAIDGCSTWVKSPDNHIRSLLTDRNVVYTSLTCDYNPGQCSDDITVMLGGFGPDFYRQASHGIEEYEEEYYRQSEYHQLDIDEFLQRSQSPAIVQAAETEAESEEEQQPESLCVKMTWQELQKQYPGVQMIDLCVPIMMRVEVS